MYVHVYVFALTTFTSTLFTKQEHRDPHVLGHEELVVTAGVQLHSGILNVIQRYMCMYV